MNKSYVVHLKNKYPGSRVEFAEDKIDVISPEGDLLIALRKNGAGQLIDCGTELGALKAFDLSEIPKNARCFKLFKDGKIGQSEEIEARREVAAKIAKDGEILSVDQYKKMGAEFDFEKNILLKGEKKEESPSLF